MSQDSAAEILEEQETAPKARPFVKWAGGKQQLLPHLLKQVPTSFNRYWEPFVGGGALFFSLGPEQATLVDANQELVNAYRVVQRNVEELIAELAKYNHDEETFYTLRKWDRMPGFRERNDIERAARFLYLNKTCFNGLYRVNSKGEFNVPFGRYKNPTIVNKENLRACNIALHGVRVLCGNFLDIESEISSDDFVYFDPPYVPLTATSSFTGYTSDGFTIDMQTSLRDLCVRLDKKGVKWLVSNSSSMITRELYKGFRVTTVMAQRAINSKAGQRGAIEEVVIRNF